MAIYFDSKVKYSGIPSKIISRYSRHCVDTQQTHSRLSLDITSHSSSDFRIAQHILSPQMTLTLIPLTVLSLSPCLLLMYMIMLL